MTFDGADDVLNTSGAIGSTKFTAYIVLRLTGAPDGIAFVAGGPSGFVGFGSTGIPRVGGSNGQVVTGTPLPVGSYAVLAGAVDSAGGPGASLGRVASSLDPAGVQATNLTFGNFSAVNFASSTNCPDAAIADIAIVSGTAHTLEQLTANIAALKTEYGIA